MILNNQTFKSSEDAQAKLSALLDNILSLEQENKNLKENYESTIENLRKQVKFLNEQITAMKIKQYSKKSESSLSIQLNLFDELIDENTVEQDIPEEKETITYTRNKKAKGRNIDTTTLPREQVFHDLPETERKCDCCNDELVYIDSDKTEQLEYIPAQIKVIEHITPKYACRACEKIKMAKKPEGPIAKSMASASLITEIIISKYQNHIPLYRRSKMFERDGIDIPDNTLGNWVMKSYSSLIPLEEAFWQETEKISHLQVDETPVKVLDVNKKGYMWCYYSPTAENKFVIFDYNISRAGGVPAARLINFEGIMQTDGYSGYNNFRNCEHIINLGCWAHCRRKFVDALNIAGKNGDGLAANAIKIIGKLYRIETQIKNLNDEERYAIRQKEASPIIEQFKEFLLSNSNKVMPNSKLGAAFTYANNQIKYLIKYIEYGHTYIDNNGAENLIRPFALGRRNWLFVGNEKGGRASGFFYSLLQTCQLNNINTRNYFNYILCKIPEIRRKQIDLRSILPQYIDIALLK